MAWTWRTTVGVNPCKRSLSTFPVPLGTKSRSISFEMKKNHLKVGLKVSLQSLMESSINQLRRPDYCLGPHLRQMLSYGCTRLEIVVVQSTYEDVARDTNRGHTVAAVADCFCLANDAGF